MTIAKKLPIYRDAMILVKQLHDSTRKAPRDLRHTLVQRLLDEATEICVCIVAANRASGDARAAHLERLAERIVRVEVLHIVAMEQRCISTGASAIVLTHLDALEIAGHANTFRLCGKWSRLAERRGLTPTPNRTKMLKPVEVP